MNGPEKFFFSIFFFVVFSTKKYIGKLCFSSVNLTNFANFLKKKSNSCDENF
jgi:hypothetical protein